MVNSRGWIPGFIGDDVPFPEVTISDPNGDRGDARKRHRVLVVGADDRLLGFVTRALDAFQPGYEVATARTPDQASRRVEAFDPGVVILDGDSVEGALANGTGWLETITSAAVLLLGVDRPGQLPGATVLPKPVRLPSLLAGMREVVS